MISEFPLFVFTSLGGLSAGLAIACALFPPAGEQKRPWLAPLLSILLLGVGLIGVLFHLGRPHLFFLALSNSSAGIAQEAYCAIAFGIVLLVQLIIAWRKRATNRIVGWVAAALGFVLTVIMGCAYIVNVGTPAWTSWATVPLFVVGDIAMGLAFWAFLEKGALERPAFRITMIVVEVLFATSLVAEALHFSSTGQGAALFYVALVLAPVVGIAGTLVKAKKPASWWPAVVLACTIVGVCVARWGFYAASMV